MLLMGMKCGDCEQWMCQENDKWALRTMRYCEFDVDYVFDLICDTWRMIHASCSINNRSHFAESLGISRLSDNMQKIGIGFRYHLVGEWPYPGLGTRPLPPLREGPPFTHRATIGGDIAAISQFSFPNPSPIFGSAEGNRRRSPLSSRLGRSVIPEGRGGRGVPNRFGGDFAPPTARGAFPPAHQLQFLSSRGSAVCFNVGRGMSCLENLCATITSFASFLILPSSNRLILRFVPQTHALSPLLVPVSSLAGIAFTVAQVTGADAALLMAIPDRCTLDPFSG